MSTTDLDLTKIKSDDPEALGAKIETYYQQDSSQKTVLAYHWERNHLMLDGQQWLVFDGNQETGGTWKRLQPTPANRYIPRPVTNYLFDVFQTLKSYLLRNKPRSSVRPNTQMHKDKAAAKLSELILNSNWEKLREEYNYEYAASCVITYGTVFKKDFWDSSYRFQAKVPIMTQRPAVDPQTGQPTGQMEEVQATDELGYPAFEELPLGDLNTSIVEPFKMAMDPLAVNLHEARWIMEYSIRPLTWITENFDKSENGFTGKAKEIKEEKNLSDSMRRFYNLRSSAGVKGNFNGASGFTSTGSDEMIDNAAIVKEYYERPTKDYPKGRLIVVANKTTLYVGDSPYEGPESGDWHPYSECRWEVVPGRFWGKSPFDSAIELQKRINSIDSVLILTRQTMAVPQKLVPRGSLPPGQWTGQPGQEVTAIPGPNGEMPQNLPANGVDSQVFQERSQAADDLKQITGAVDILKGEKPSGVTAASALALLHEIGTGKLFPVLDRWKRFVEASQKKQLRIVAHKYKEPRPDFINMLLAKNRELTEDQIKNFVGEDLHDNTNVVIEATSSIPQLQAAKHALLLELATKGVLNLENPANKQEFLSRFGIEGFDNDYNKDVKRAQWENDLIANLDNSPDNKPIVLDIDNHQVHIGIHSEWMKEPAFMDQPFTIQQEAFLHLQEHEQKIQEAQQMQQMQAMATGMPPQPAPPNPMEAQENIRAGSGVTPAVMDAIAPDASTVPKG